MLTKSIININAYSNETASVDAEFYSGQDTQIRMDGDPRSGNSSQNLCQKISRDISTKYGILDRDGAAVLTKGNPISPFINFVETGGGGTRAIYS